MMKVSEFEQAVDALGCGIEIDEVKLGMRGLFRKGYGHKGNILIMCMQTAGPSPYFSRTWKPERLLTIRMKALRSTAMKETECMT